MTDHAVTVVATRDKHDQPAYLALTSCARHRTPNRATNDQAEHDAREHLKYRADVAAIVRRD